MILGRVIQGAGAISAAVIALAADLTRDEQRTKAMAIIGMTIGATFSLSLIAGPVLGRVIGVPGVFAMTGVLALAALAVVRWVVPDPPPAMPRQKARRGRVACSQPPAQPRPGAAELGHLRAARGADGAVRGAAIRAARRRSARRQTLADLSAGDGRRSAADGAAFVDLRAARKTEGRVPGGHLRAAWRPDSAGRNAGLGARHRGCRWWCFSPRSTCSRRACRRSSPRLAPAGAKGAAVGVYSSVQFLGTFVGAAAGGFVSQYFGTPAVFALCGLLTLSWLLVAWPMSAPAAVGVRT